MITGIVFIIISIFSFYLVYKTDYEDDVVRSEFKDEEVQNKNYLYLGIAILFVFGIILTIRNIK